MVTHHGLSLTTELICHHNKPKTVTAGDQPQAFSTVSEEGVTLAFCCDILDSIMITERHGLFLSRLSCLAAY